MNSHAQVEDKIVVETLAARESLLKSFNGDAHLYFINALERDRARIATAERKEKSA